MCLEVLSTLELENSSIIYQSKYIIYDLFILNALQTFNVVKIRRYGCGSLVILVVMNIYPTPEILTSSFFFFWQKYSKYKSPLLYYFEEEKKWFSFRDIFASSAYILKLFVQLSVDYGADHDAYIQLLPLPILFRIFLY